MAKSREEVIDIRPVPLATVANLVVQYHGYAGCGNVATYCFGVFEGARVVAAFSWNPCAHAAARALSAAPGGAGVLSLTRMVAVPREQRRMQHISKALYRQTSRLIDRGRWPVLVTYSDASLGHTGHVYKCAGWQPDGARRALHRTVNGTRMSRYSNGRMLDVCAGDLVQTVITRWVLRACPAGSELAHMQSCGWRRVALPGRVWASGAAAYTWVRGAPQ